MLGKANELDQLIITVFPGVEVGIGYFFKEITKCTIKEKVPTLHELCSLSRFLSAASSNLIGISPQSTSKDSINVEGANLVRVF